MNDIRILIARLDWPSTTVRWWAMQELAARLGDSVKRCETESALTQRLRKCRLEAEVVETLCVFWISAKGYGYLPNIKLADNIKKPSLLSSQLLKSLGISDKYAAGDLTEVPKNFESPEDFYGVQGVDLPKIFMTNLRRFETVSSLPFVKQMAFEWTKNRDAYPDAPYQGEAWHFIRPLGDGFIGQLSSRTALRTISAYLRALEVGKNFWKISDSVINDASLLALPIHPTLAFLTPNKPDWFISPIAGFSEDSNSTEIALRTMLARFEETRPGDELIAFSSPVLVSMELCIEVSMVRWSQAVNSSVSDENLAEHLKVYLKQLKTLPSESVELLSTVTTVKYTNANRLLDEQSASWPLACYLDYYRMGYLQHDLYPGRLFIPNMVGETEIMIAPESGKLKMSADIRDIAEFNYWNAGWGPARPQQFQGNCGTALVSRGKAYRELAVSSAPAIRDFYLWQVRILRRSNTFDRFNESINSGIIFI